MIQLTREQALEEYVQVKRQIEELRTKEKNLRAIILMQQVAPQRKPVGQPRGKGGVNQNEATILRIIRDVGLPISASSISENCNINKDTIYTVLGRLTAKNVIHRMKDENSVTYTLAVQQSNGIADGGITA